MTDPVLVEPARTVALRQRVLRPHQSEAEVAATTDVAGGFAVAVLEADAVVSCVLAVPEPCPDPVAPVGPGGAWRLRGMATDPGHRGRGLGAAVLGRTLAEVGARGGAVVWCNARIPARTLYERAGFRVVGSPWDDPLLGPHIRMWRAVASTAEPTAPATPEHGRAMTTRHGTMRTDRPERYAKQLAGHWARKGTVAEDDDATVIRLDGGNEVRLRPAGPALDVEATVPEGGDADRWARVVAEHLERFGHRDELHVVWDATEDGPG